VDVHFHLSFCVDCNKSYINEEEFIHCKEAVSF